MRSTCLLAAAFTTVTLGARPALASGPCRVVSPSATLGAVRVAPVGAAPFDLEVSEAPAVAYPPPETAPSDTPLVDVETAIRFVARAPHAVYSLPHGGEATRGIALLAPGTILEHVRAHGAGAVADVLLMRGVHAKGVALTCADLDLTEGTLDAIDFDDDDATPTVVPRSKELALRVSDTDPRLVTRLVTDAPGALTLLDLGSHGDLVHLGVRTSGGTWIEGWAPRRDVTPPAAGIGLGFSGSGGSGCDVGTGVLDPAIYRGPAALHAGATVYAEPGHGPWGTTSTRVVEVMHRTGDRFAQVIAVHGLGDGCGDLEHAYVEVGAVTMPSRHAI